jgi:hypothetical protein
MRGPSAQAHLLDIDHSHFPINLGVPEPARSSRIGVRASLKIPSADCQKGAWGGPFKRLETVPPPPILPLGAVIRRHLRPTALVARGEVALQSGGRLSKNVTSGAIRRRRGAPGESCPPGRTRYALRPSRSRRPFGRARRTRSRPRRRPSSRPC